MKRTGNFLKTNTQRYALAGASFGLLFPILATFMRILEAGLPFSFASIIYVHLADPLLWIIDTAPAFLGIFAALAGRRQDDLEKTNQMLRTREQELEDAQLAMEQQVNERTQELTYRNQAILERAERLKSVVETSRSLIATQEIDRLLPTIVQMVSRQFKYDHVGIYLLDEQEQHAVLVAASSEGGARIIERGKHLSLSEQSPVEYALHSGQARVIEETSKDPLFKPEPELPGTCSELVLPLKSGQAVIGALDLQSRMQMAFTEEYISVLSILSDLVAVAIQNSMLNENTQRALREVEANIQQNTSKVWGRWLESIKARGYRYDGIRAEPLKEVDVSSVTGRKTQSIPIRLRGRTIGNLKIKLSEASQGWTEDDHAIAAATAERTALALEGARLLDNAKRRAAREAFLSEMGTKLSTSFRLDSIIRDTVEELGQTLQGSTISFQLVNPAAPPPATETKAWNVPPVSSDNSE